jgi:hypothetical protein
MPPPPARAPGAAAGKSRAELLAETESEAAMLREMQRKQVCLPPLRYHRAREQPAGECAVLFLWCFRLPVHLKAGARAGKVGRGMAVLFFRFVFHGAHTPAGAPQGVRLLRRKPRCVCAPVHAAPPWHYYPLQGVCSACYF